MIIKCEKGKHYYNTVEHSVCPFCKRLYETNSTSLRTENNSGETMTETETMLEPDRKNAGYRV